MIGLAEVLSRLRSKASEANFVHRPEGHQANVDQLVQQLTGVPGWETEFLPWSSGLMLCVRN